MILIKELIQEVRVIQEDVGTGKNLYIEGIFLQGGIKNRNGRIYPVETLDKAVSSYIKEYVESNRAYGECTHPTNPQINLDRVSHLIVELKKNGKDWYGKAKLLNTPMGNIAKGIMEGGGQLGVSSRALGTLKEENGSMVVQDDLVICTAADIVADPSAPEAYVQAVMENKEWIYVDGHFVERDIESAKKNIQQAGSKQLEEQFVREFVHFLDKIKNI